MATKRLSIAGCIPAAGEPLLYPLFLNSSLRVGFAMNCVNLTLTLLHTHAIIGGYSKNSMEK